MEASGRMNITFLLDDANAPSGGHRVLAQNAAYLKARGHKVLLLSRPRLDLPLRQRLRIMFGRRPPRRAFTDADSHFHAAGLKVVWTPPGRPIGPEDAPEADVLIASWWECAKWMDEMPASKGRQIHVIQDHENFPYLPRDEVRAVLRNPRRKIAVSRWLVRVMREEYGVEAELAPNGVDAAWFDAPPRERNPEFRVGALYSSAPRKNFGLALEGLARARAQLPGLRVHVFGAHDPGARLPDWIEFEFRPSQERIREIYGACDAWLFVSRSEGFGLPILEAMACRTPVLATGAGAAPDLIEDGVNGRLLPEHPEAFAEALVEIATLSPEAWRSMSAAARATAVAHDLRHVVTRFEALILE